MSSRAMVVVGGGASARFGRDKLLTPIAGEPLVVHTINAVKSTVDTCVLVCRSDQHDELATLGLGIELAVGGPTRTRSEIAGLSVLGEGIQLIGIHDAARPLVGRELIDRLFDEAARSGGAIPVIEPKGPVIDRSTMNPVRRAKNAQTPQVFRGPELIEAFRLAACEGFEGHDTAEVVSRFTATEIVAVPGNPGNIKVTFPEDLTLVEKHLSRSARNAPR